MNNVKTPEELLDFMSNNINYGYLGKNGHIYHFDDDNFYSDWFSKYILQSKEDILKNLYANCYDQVEFEREWFLNNGYEVKTFFEMVYLDYKNDYNTHAYLLYKDNNEKWCVFENADYDRRGIFKFDTLNDAIKHQYNAYLDSLKEKKITDEDINKIIIREFDKPKEHISTEEYLDHVINSKIIDIK